MKPNRKTIPYTLLLLLLLGGNSFAKTTNSLNNPPAFTAGETLTTAWGGNLSRQEQPTPGFCLTWRLMDA